MVNRIGVENLEHLLNVANVLHAKNPLGAINRAYNDKVCDTIDNYHCSAYYEPSYVIAGAYLDGSFWEGKMNFEEYTYGSIACRALEDAEFLKESRPHLAAFFAQQTVEGILKHYVHLYYVGTDKAPLLETHNLIVLMQKSEIEELRRYDGILRVLSSFYSNVRYPGAGYTIPSREDVEEMIPQDFPGMMSREGITLKLIGVFGHPQPQLPCCHNRAIILL